MLFLINPERTKCVCVCGWSGMQTVGRLVCVQFLNKLYTLTYTDCALTLHTVGQSPVYIRSCMNANSCFLICAILCTMRGLSQEAVPQAICVILGRMQLLMHLSMTSFGSTALFWTMTCGFVCVFMHMYSDIVVFGSLAVIVLLCFFCKCDKAAGFSSMIVLVSIKLSI